MKVLLEMEKQDFDDLIDEVNEFHLLYDYVTDFGSISKDELNFNGDVESAKRYEENDDTISAFIDYEDDNFSDSVTKITCDDNINASVFESFSNFSRCDDDVLSPSYFPSAAKQMSTSQLRTDEIGTEETTDAELSHDFNFSLNQSNKTSLSSNNDKNIEFPIPRYYSSPMPVTSFQQQHEQRSKYLIRSLKLWQEFSNSGNIDRLRVLFNDILDVKCVMINGPSPPVVGRDTIYTQVVSLLRNIPDFCVFYTNIVRSKKRVITMKSNNFGTFPYANANEGTKKAWNFFEVTPIDKLDEHHKIQKQKYDTLKSQNKIIRFERRVTRHLMLSRNLKRIVKFMSCNIKIFVY